MTDNTVETGITGEDKLSVRKRSDGRKGDPLEAVPVPTQGSFRTNIVATNEEAFQTGERGKAERIVGDVI